MAQRRMMAITVVGTDRFMSLSLSAQALYMHLVLRADDDGFVDNPRTIQRMVGAAEADFVQLKAAGMIIDFVSGIVVVTDWRIMNRVSPAKYQPTTYLRELGCLYITPAEKYTMEPEQGVVKASEVAGDAERYKNGKQTIAVAIGKAFKKISAGSGEAQEADEGPKDVPNNSFEGNPNISFEGNDGFVGDPNISFEGPENAENPGNVTENNRFLTTDTENCANKRFDGSGQSPDNVQPSIGQCSITENPGFPESIKTDVRIDPDTGEILEEAGIFGEDSVEEADIFEEDPIESSGKASGEGNGKLTESDVQKIVEAWNGLCSIHPDVFRARKRPPKMETQLIASIEAFLYDMDLDGVDDLCGFIRSIAKSYYPDYVRPRGVPARRFEWLFDRDYRTAQENMMSLYKRGKAEAAKAAARAAEEAAARQAEQARMGQSTAAAATMARQTESPRTTSKPAKRKSSIMDFF